MSPEQFQTFLEDNRKSTAQAIKETVNGKIDTISNKLDDHITTHDSFMKDVKPILQAYQGGKTFGDLLKWMGGIILTVSAAWLAIKGFFIK